MWKSILKAFTPMPKWVKEKIAEIMSNGEPIEINILAEMLFKERPPGSLDFPPYNQLKRYLDTHASITRVTRQGPIKYAWRR